MLRSRVYGKDDNLGFRAAPADALCRLDAVELWHGNIHDHYVRQQTDDVPDCLKPVGRMADNLDISSCLQQHPETVPDNRMIVRQKYVYAHDATCLSSTTIFVPFPGADSTRNSPPTASALSLMVIKPNFPPSVNEC